jgi:putative transposase
LTKRRSGWPVERTLSALGVSRTTYYRWQRAASLRVAEELSVPPPPPIQPYEALPEEKAAVIEYALKHPELRHRELAWRMVDEDMVYVSSSTVYRILREAKLVCPSHGIAGRKRTCDYGSLQCH